jgi:hypothetical protein
MCLQNDGFVKLGACPHGAYHLRLGNTTLHLTQMQVMALHAELNRCVKGPNAKQKSPQPPIPPHRLRFGQTPN